MVPFSARDAVASETPASRATASSVTWAAVRVAVQSPSAAPAAHWMPPRRCLTNPSSWKDAASCPPAVNHERPPS